jgi:mycothiol synthase
VPTTSPELSWLAASTPALAVEVEALAAAAALTDGTPPLSEQVLRPLRPGVDGAGIEHLVARDGCDSAEEPPPGGGNATEEPPPDGVGSSDTLGDSSDMLGRTLVGYAQLDRSDPADVVAELVVHPAYRRAGIGSGLVGALLARTPSLRVWAHGGHPGAAALAARFGFVGDRELWRMRRSLREPLAVPVLPDGLRLRSFVVGADEDELLRVNNAAFAWHPEQGGWTPADVRQREAEPWFDAAGVLLAVDEADPGHVLGFHWTKVHPAGAGGADPDAPIGEVYVLAVDPAARGRRLGPALTLAGLAYLRDRGLDAVMLYVEADNAAAVRVYRDLGFSAWGADVSYRH